MVQLSVGSLYGVWGILTMSHNVCNFPIEEASYALQLQIELMRNKYHDALFVFR